MNQPELQSGSWPGLNGWRAKGLDEGRSWGARGPESQASEHLVSEPNILSQAPESLAEAAEQVLRTADPELKAQHTHHAWQQHMQKRLKTGSASPPDSPARPSLPQLVPVKSMPTPKQSPLPLNVFMMHNLAHVELNAIDLAWDTVARFSALGLDEAFYEDFAHVADDESRHLRWCLQRLRELGYDYGCMPAHNMLWEGAEKSSDSVSGRLAVVPMSQEARGLDAGPRLVDRLIGWGDQRSAAIVARIGQEEKAHVAVGVHWFRLICAAEGADMGETFKALLHNLAGGLAKGPFNHEARAEVGLKQAWYDSSQWQCDPVLPEQWSRNAQSASLQPAEMELLKQRLTALLDVELSNAEDARPQPAQPNPVACQLVAS
ncbi:hypothetical protein WJX74_005146 [Apatococcus lobatus]|uniref:Ferritin-like domain-containing protein n=2 Tax=Apatococcus TaxID=904362 RepID=A0AAW1SYC1_9CHLO